MGINKKNYEAFKYMSIIFQLGINVVVSCMLIILSVSWLKNKFDLGDWIVYIGVVLAILTGFASFVSFFKMAMKDAKKSQEEYENNIKGKKE